MDVISRAGIVSPTNIRIWIWRRICREHQAIPRNSYPE